MRHLPLALTLFRLLAAPIVGVLIIAAHQTTYLIGPAQSALIYAIAGFLFIAAALTDFLDGWLARKLNAVTPLGAALDHVADKALVSGALVALAYALLSWQLVLAAMLLIVRDVAVAGLREASSASGRTVAVGGIGKLKAGAQMTAVPALLFLPAASFAPPAVQAILSWVGTFALWSAVALALISAGFYARAAFAPAAPEPDSTGPVSN